MGKTPTLSPPVDIRYTTLALEDLRDSLDLLDARARDDGRRYSADVVRAKLGLDPLKR